MKKIMVMMVLSVMLVQGIFAQSGSSAFENNQDAHIALGVKGGVGFNWASGALGKPSAGMLPKGNVGFFGEYAFMKYIAIQSDFMLGINHGFRRQDYQIAWNTMDFDIIIKGRLPIASFVLSAGAGLSLSTGIGRLTERVGDDVRKVNFADYNLNAVGMGAVVELGFEYTLPGNTGYVGTSFRTDWKFNPYFKPMTYVDEMRLKGSVHTPVAIMLFYGYRWQQQRLNFLG